MAPLLAYLCIAYALVVGLFHPLHRPRRDRDLRPYIIYFVAFFVLFFLGPLFLVMVIRGGAPGSLAAVGLTLGNIRRSLPIMALGAPVCVLAGWIGSRDPAIRNFYPFSKEACRSRGAFLAFELAYLILYYPAWEFLYRGVLLFPLVPALGLLPALLPQTLISAAYHVGHPPSEILASAGAGIVFGLIAFWTGSILVTALLHALVGISTDTFLYLRFCRKPTA